MSNYVSVAELKAFKNSSGVVYTLTAFTDPELQAILDSTEDLFHRLTGNRFGKYTEVWIIDGTGEPALMFPPAITYPLISVSSVESLNEDGTVYETLEENVDFVNRKHYLLAGAEGLGETARFMILTSGSWAKGLRNYKVSGTWGMSSVPAMIKRLICLYALETLIPGITRIASGNVESFRLGDYSVTFRDTATNLNHVNKILTGFPMIDAILKQYVMYSSMMLNHTEYAYLQSSVFVP